MRKHFQLPNQSGQHILNESKALRGKTLVYELLGEELRLTIFAAKSLQDGDET